MSWSPYMNWTNVSELFSDIFLKHPVKLAYVSHLSGINADDYMHEWF